MKVALLSDCYLPRLGGIEVQVHDLAAPADEPRSPGRGLHRDPGPARRAARRRRTGSTASPCTGWRCGCRGTCRSTRSPRLSCATAARAAFDVAHVHMGVVSPFAVDAARSRRGLGLPTAMTWHCMLGALEPALSGGSGYVRRWAERRHGHERRLRTSRRRRCSGSSATAGAGRGAAQRHRRGPLGRPGRPARPSATDDGVRLVSAMRLAGRKRPDARCCASCAACGTSSGPPYRCTLEVLGEGPRPRPARAVRRPARHGGVGQPARPGRARGAAATGTPAPTSTSPPAGSSRSASPRWRRGPPGCRSWSRAAAASGEFVQDGVNGFLAAGRRGDGARRGPAGAGRRPARPDGGAQPRAPAPAVLGADLRRRRGRVRPGAVAGAVCGDPGATSRSAHRPGGVRGR